MSEDLITKYSDILGPDAPHTGITIERQDGEGVLIIRGIGKPVNEIEIREALEKLIAFYKVEN